MNGSGDAADIWRAFRSGELTGPTTGLVPGCVQADLAVLPRSEAFDFLRFCQRNPEPCPIVEVTDAGDPQPRLTAPGADLRTDPPRYRVYRHGELTDEPTDITTRGGTTWSPSSSGAASFEHTLLDVGVPVRHLAAGRNVPMYRTTRRCTPAGRFDGPLVVSMRLIPAVAEPGDVPGFWACGVTPQAVALEARARDDDHARSGAHVRDRHDQPVRTRSNRSSVCVIAARMRWG